MTDNTPVPTVPAANFRFFDHDADLGVAASAHTLEAALEGMAYAVFSVISDPAQVQAHEWRQFEFDETDPELALVTWLNLLLGTAQAEHLVFGQFSLQRDGTHWSGEAAGEPWRADLPRGVEVKGATLTMLSVRQVDGRVEAQCVVDV